MRVRPLPCLADRTGLPAVTVVVIACVAALPVTLTFVPEAAATSPAAQRDEDLGASLLFNTASRLYRQQNWKDAASAFGDFLEKYPRHADAVEARFARGYCFNRLGRHGDAAGDLRLAARDESRRWAADASFYLGASLESLAAAPTTGDATSRRLLLEAASSYRRAARLRLGELDELPADAPADRRELLRDLHVLALASAGEAMHRARAYRDAIGALTPLRDGLDRWRGARACARGIYFLALSRYELAREAEATGRRADYEPAIATLSLLGAPEFEEDPLWAEAIYLLGRLEQREGKLQSALARFERLAARGGERAIEAEYHAAIVLQETRTPRALEAAAERLARFRQRHRDSPLVDRALLHEGLALFDLRRYDEAASRLDALVASRVDVDVELRERASFRLGQALLLASSPDLDRAVAVLTGVVDRARERSPVDREQLARAIYWLAEALLAHGGDSLARAAATFGEVAERHRRDTPDLAEEALHKTAVAFLRAGEHARCAAAGRLYRSRHRPGTARFLVESLEISARNALEAPAGALPDAERSAAGEHYARAAALAETPSEARRLRSLAGLAHYHAGSFDAAIETLEEVFKTPTVAGETDAALERSLSFYLADALVQRYQPREGAEFDDEARRRLSRAVTLYGRFIDDARRDRTAVARDNLSTAVLHRGLCHQWLDEPARARDSFEDFLRTWPRDALAPRVRLGLAEACVKLGDLERAADEYRAAASASGDRTAAARALLRAAWVERKLDRPRRALAVLDTAIATLSGSADAALLADARYQRAAALDDLGMDGAETALRDFLDRHGESARTAEIRLRLAWTCLDDSRPRDALDAIAPLVGDRRGATPERAEALYVQAWSHAAIADTDGVEDDDREAARAALESSYRVLIAEHPESEYALDARLELGEHLFNRRALSEARRWLESALERAESASTLDRDRREKVLARARFGLAFIDAEENDHVRARERFDAVAGAGGELATRALFQAARSWMSTRGEREAVKRFRRVLEDTSKTAVALHAETLLRLAECHHRLREYETALKFARQLVEHHADGPLLHEGRFAAGFALQYLDRFDEAVKAFREVVSGTRAVVAARAQYHIGECYMDRRRYRESAREFLAVAANFDFEGEYRDWLRRSLLAAGLAYQAAGDGPAAAQQWKELVERFGDSSEARAGRKRLEEVNE